MLLPGTASSERCRLVRVEGMAAQCGAARHPDASGNSEIRMPRSAHSIHSLDSISRPGNLNLRFGAARITLRRHADPASTRPTRQAALRPRPLRRRAVRARGDAPPDARPSRSRVPRHPRRGDRAAARRLAHARRRRLALPSTGTSAMEAGIVEPARAGRHGDRRRGRLLRPPPGRHRRAPRRPRRAASPRRGARPCRTRRCSTRSTRIPRRA